MTTFRDRTDAAEQLVDRLRGADVRADVVLAIPRGGLPIGRIVADALDAPLDVIVSKKLGAPGNPELAIGAVTSDGSKWVDEDLLDRLGVSESYLERETERVVAAVAEKERRYRGDRPPLDLAGKTVLVVDDGVATGATTIACLREARAAGAERTVLAVPVAPAEALDRLETVADEVLVVATPRPFGAVGAHYASFDQVSDEEAAAYLER